MKKAFHKIAAISMALLVLFTTTSFSVDMHYCGDHLVDFSLSGNVDTCMMKAEMSKSSSSCAMMEMKMDCCSDLELSVIGHDDLKVSFDQLTLEQQVFVTSFVNSYTGLLLESSEKVTHFIDYSPPPLIRDVQILDQTFLI
ncbi:HYC_CC_PP family protein [Maribacter sp. CXY002]|uniref:HYC_CC_PP family protein n=1 Tax=Maribacter luteocoastalis TaxID=3407671 RepID=UPI003B685229